MNNRVKASLVIILVLAIIIGIALLSGIQGAIPANGMRIVTVKVLGVSQYSGAANPINLTYSSVGIHFTSANYSSWDYYNATQQSSLGGNVTYSVARFSIPYNSMIDGAELTVLSSNVSVTGAAYPAYFAGGRLYFAVSPIGPNSTTALVLRIKPTELPVISGASLSFAVKPYLTAQALNGEASYNLTALQSTAPEFYVSRASITQAGNRTDINITLHNNSTTPAVISSVVVVGNFIISGNVSDATVLESIASAALNNSKLEGMLPSAQGLNLSVIPGSGQISGIITNNSGFLASIESHLPSNIKSAISSTASYTYIQLQNLTASAGQYLSGINTSEYKSVLVQTLSNISSADNKTYLQNQNIATLESMVGSLGGLKNSSVYNGIVSGVIGGEYKQYLAKASVLRSAEHALGTVAFAVTSNGMLVPLSYAGQLNSTSHGLTLGAQQTAILGFSGALSAGPEGTLFTTTANNTYKIIVLGNNTVANATVVSVK